MYTVLGQGVLPLANIHFAVAAISSLFEKLFVATAVNFKVIKILS